MTAVTLRNLSVIYPNTTAPVLDNFNLEIPSGKLTIVLGPSGCGKSTLMKLIGGLLEPSKGDILFDDVSVLPIPPEKRDAVMVFQNYLLFPHLNVFENICFGLRMRALGDATIAFGTTALAVLIGVPAGRALSLYSFRGKIWFELLIFAPVIVPTLAVVLGIHIVFTRLNLANHAFGVILAHLIPATPYSVLVMASVFANYDVNYEAQARTLGASSIQVIWH